MNYFLINFVEVIIILIIITLIQKIIKLGFKNLIHKVAGIIKEVYEYAIKNVNKVIKFLNIITLFYFIIISFINYGNNDYLKIFLYDENKANIFIEDIKRVLNSIKSYFLCYIMILIILFIINKIRILLCCQYQRNKAKKVFLKSVEDSNEELEDCEEEYITELYKNLYTYLSNESNEKNNSPILITGEWGSGKTFAVDNFLNKYYKYSSKKIYKISCFGINTIENFMKRIENVCESEDNGLFNKFMDIIGKIPIIGVFLKNILEKKYDINNIKKGSIFIFDNFERIEVCDWSYNNGIRTVENDIEVLAKYNIVLGTIDELIEIYKMKVIIIANENEMVPGYVYDTFISKLACKKYTIKKKDFIFSEIWNNIISKEIYVEEKYKKIFEEIFKNVEETTLKIWKDCKCNNIRILHKCLYNYVNYILHLLQNNHSFDCRIDEKLSIYYTNLLINLKYVKGLVMEKGDNIGLSYLISTLGCDDSIFEIDAIWFTDNYTKEKWINLEQNNVEMRQLTEDILSKTNCDIQYLTPHNCLNKEFKIDKIYLENIMILLIIKGEDFIENAIKIFNSANIYNFEKDSIRKWLKNDKLGTMFFDNVELRNSFFKAMERNCTKERNKEIIEELFQSNLVFQKIYNKYTEQLKTQESL